MFRYPIILIVVSFVFSQNSYNEEYDFINWFFKDRGDVIYLLDQSSQNYTRKMWNASRNEALDYAHLANDSVFFPQRIGKNTVVDYLSIEEISKMKEESYVGMTFKQDRLDKKIVLIKERDYDTWSPDSTTGYYEIGRPLLNESKTICIIYVAYIHSYGNVKDGLMVYERDEGMTEWNYLMQYP